MSRSATTRITIILFASGRAPDELLLQGRSRPKIYSGKHSIKISSAKHPRKISTGNQLTKIPSKIEVDKNRRWVNLWVHRLVIYSHRERWSCTRRKEYFKEAINGIKDRNLRVWWQTPEKKREYIYIFESITGGKHPREKKKRDGKIFGSIDSSFIPIGSTIGVPD